MRSRAGYVIGGGLVALGVLGAVLWFVGSLRSMGDQVDDFQRVAIPGEAAVRLEARKYVVYYESPTGGDVVPPFQLEIADPRTGASLPIASYGGSLAYSISGRSGSAQATVTPERAGTYAVRTDSAQPTGGNVALGGSLAWPILRGLLGTFAIGGVLVAGGAILLVVTAVRRSRVRGPDLEARAGSWFDHPDQPGGQRMNATGNTGPLGQPRGIGFGILLFIVTFGIYSLYWSYKTHEEVKQHSGEGLGGVLGLVVWILISAVSAFVIPSEIGKMYAKDGREPPVTGWTGLWLFPGSFLLIPAIVWFVKVQGALNRYWEAKASMPAAPA